MKIRIKYNFLPLRKSWIAGITIYPFIFFKRSKEEVSDVLFRHEMQHIYQVERMGWFKFYISYLWILRKGYRVHPYELEAVAHENDPLTDEERRIKDQV